MNVHLGAHSTNTITIPPEYEVLCPLPQLLPGESVEQYHALQNVIFRDIAPRSAVEWLLAIDIAELSWEMRRYRLLRQRLLSTFRHRAVEATLRRIDLAGIAPHLQQIGEFHTVKNALDWQLDPFAARDIEARLHSHGFDQHALNMEVYVQARGSLALFETLLNGAQLRRLLLLKEIGNMRWSGLARTRSISGGEGSRSPEDEH